MTATTKLLLIFHLARGLSVFSFYLGEAITFLIYTQNIDKFLLQSKKLSPKT